MVFLMPFSVHLYETCVLEAFKNPSDSGISALTPKGKRIDHGSLLFCVQILQIGTPLQERHLLKKFSCSV
jgi:hypothetical protein